MSLVESIQQSELGTCRHCGTEFRAYAPDEAYCCSGCEYVYQLIHEENLDKFYNLDDKPKSPVGFSVFTTPDFQWLEQRIEAIETQYPDNPSLLLSLSGISCIGCVWLMDQLFAKQSGGRNCRINVQKGEIQIEWKSGCFDAVSFAQKLHRFGYELCQKKTEIKSDNVRLVWRIAVCGALALNSMLYTLPSYLGMEKGFAFSLHFNWLTALFASMSMLVGGSYFIKRSIAAARQKIVHMDLPISIGLGVAYFASIFAFLKGGYENLIYFDFISTFVFLMLCGKWLQIFAIERNRNRLSAIEIEPPLVDKMSGESCIRNFDSKLIKPGDHYFLKPGDWVPCESELFSDRACQGMDWINGEQESRLFPKGAIVPSGSINQNDSPIELLANERWEESLLYKLLQSREEKSPEDRVAQKWISRYLIAVVLIATFGALAWITMGQASQALTVFVSALVVSCPCALGVALPLANELALSRLKLKGVFVRSTSLWNRLSQVSQIVFDKTGTLTRSSMDWTNREIVHSLDEDALEALSALTINSRHPVATTVRETLFSKGFLRNTNGWNIEEIIGCGTSGERDGIQWRFGKASWAGRAESNATVLSRERKTIATFNFEDRPWADAPFEINTLKNRGVRIAILSGDKRENVRKAAKILGIEERNAIGEATPEAKERWLRAHQGNSTLILGDGANDSLAFDEALCCGTPAAEKTTLASKSDFYYLGAGIQGVRTLLEIAAKRRTAIQVLLGFAIAYNIVAISLALTGIITPLLAAILMPLSSIASLALVWAVLKS